MLMRVFNFKSLVLAAATMMGMSAQAQVTFQMDRDFRDLIGYPAHRTNFNMIDFNGDDVMDGVYCGTSYTMGWNARAVLVKGLGDGKFDVDFEGKYENYATQEPVIKKDAEGNNMVDEEGNPVYETDETGEIIYQEVEHQRFVGMESGMPLSAYAWGYPLDYNQDGLVDMLLQNRGGNDTGTEQRLVLVKNLGNYKFEQVNDECIATTCYGYGGDKYNEGNEFACVDIADYDQDGYPDIIYQTYGYDQHRGGWSRYVQLLHNNKGEGYECADVFRPLPFDQEINHAVIYDRTQDSIYVDEDGVEQTIPGTWTQNPSYRPKQLSNGCAQFIDLNGDGWKDVVVAGWGDGWDGEDGGWQFRYYVNTCDGWFTDNTDKLIASIEGASSLKDVFKAWGHNDLIYYPMDYNQDGAEDLVLIGSLDDRNGKQALAVLNTSAGGETTIQEIPTNMPGVTGVSDSEGTILFGDFNGDDVVDFYSMSWTDYNQIHDWRCMDVMSNGIDSYTITERGWTGQPDNGMYIGQGGMSVGDLNNDDKLDLVCHTWSDKADDVIPSYNVTEFTPVHPDAPQDVTATTDGNGNVVVTWSGVTLSASGGKAMYNVYAIDKTNGTFRMLVPANPETGKQSGYAKFNRYVLGGLDDEPKFTFRGLPAGEYTVGVQAVSYNWLASPFTTTTIKVGGEDGIQQVANPESAEAAYYTIQGIRLQNAPAKGVYVVKEAGKAATKVIK